mmetsp:Transcript_93765/g.268341  ORF Transcript_93765/g.268341 Transcript_93765/m.268341 type:complete len:216 (-) Transcript_93765:1754-2401(-)
MQHLFTGVSRGCAVFARERRFEVDTSAVGQEAKALEDLLVREAIGKGRARNPNGLEHARAPQLLCHHVELEARRRFESVRLDATDVLDRGSLNNCHKLSKLVLKFGRHGLCHQTSPARATPATATSSSRTASAARAAAQRTCKARGDQSVGGNQHTLGEVDLYRVLVLVHETRRCVAYLARVVTDLELNLRELGLVKVLVFLVVGGDQLLAEGFV